MQRLQKFAITLGARSGVSVDLYHATVQDRIALIYASIGVMPHRSSRVLRIDKNRLWGPGNLKWSELRRYPSWSPTAQCDSCQSWKTRIVSTYRRQATRSHECRNCGARFRTSMLEYEQPPRPSTRRRLKEVAAASGISARVIGARLAIGWTLERAISKPVQKRERSTGRNGKKQ